MHLRTRTILLIAFFSLLHLPQALAQNRTKEGEQPIAITVPINVEQAPEDALDRGTPRGSALGFLEACARLDFERAAQYLDLRNLPPEIDALGGKELARQLNHVLARSVWLDDYSVSDKPGGARGDGLPDYRDLLVTVTDHSGVGHPIWLQHVPREDGERIWKISNRSLALVPDLYDEFSYPPIVEKVRTWFPEDWSFAGLEAFKWFIVLVVALLAWPVLWAFGWLISRLVSSPDRPSYLLVRKAFKGPFVLIGIIVVLGITIDKLGAGAYAQMWMNAKTLSIVAVIWALWVLISLFRSRQQARLIAVGRPGAAKLMQPISTLFKILVLMFGLLFWLNNLGVNITTVLAGLGVGGLAVALALQKPIEDMMGALSIFSQAPFRVGDMCRYGEVLGVVEDIGLRTTRIRTLTDTVVSIPNAQMAYNEVENLSYREKIRYWPTLRLRYDTRPEQLTGIRDAIHQLLANHEQVHDDPVRVRITDFDRDAILIKIHCFLKTSDFSESLEIGEELNLRIMEIIERNEARFALPSATLHLEGGDTVGTSL